MSCRYLLTLNFLPDPGTDLLCSLGLGQGSCFHSLLTRVQIFHCRTKAQLNSGGGKQGFDNHAQLAGWLESLTAKSEASLEGRFRYLLVPGNGFP